LSYTIRARHRPFQHDRQEAQNQKPALSALAAARGVDLTAIGEAHKAAGFDSPRTHQLVVATRKGIRRRLGAETEMSTRGEKARGRRVAAARGTLADRLAAEARGNHPSMALVMLKWTLVL
jgi:hypothetical protein